jgi:hypothetical protein
MEISSCVMIVTSTDSILTGAAVSPLIEIITSLQLCGPLAQPGANS